MSADEAGRLAALRRYRVLDTAPEQAFDDLAVLAAQICGTPMALISLVDGERLWFKARVGVAASETPRATSFCAHAITQTDLFVVPDALEDPRFCENPLVLSEPHIRFYAGAPLVTPDGHALGTIAVIDRVPRTLTLEQEAALEALRRQVSAQLELRHNAAELTAALRERDLAEDAQERLVQGLRSALDSVERLSSLTPNASTCQINIVIPADPFEIPTVTDGVAQVLRDRSWAEDRVIEVELALQEALSNAIRHGCEGDRSKRIECRVTLDRSDEVVIVVRDPGHGFDAGSLPSPMAAENIFKPRGRGIFLIDRLMDEVLFADEGREIHMRKRAARVPAGPPAGA